MLWKLSSVDVSKVVQDATVEVSCEPVKVLSRTLREPHPNELCMLVATLKAVGYKTKLGLEGSCAGSSSGSSKTSALSGLQQPPFL